MSASCPKVVDGGNRRYASFARASYNQDNTWVFFSEQMTQSMRPYAKKSIQRGGRKKKKCMGALSDSESSCCADDALWFEFFECAQRRATTARTTAAKLEEDPFVCAFLFQRYLAPLMQCGDRSNEALARQLMSGEVVMIRSSVRVTEASGGDARNVDSARGQCCMCRRGGAYHQLREVESLRSQLVCASCKKRVCALLSVMATLERVFGGVHLVEGVLPTKYNYLRDSLIRAREQCAEVHDDDGATLILSSA